MTQARLRQCTNARCKTKFYKTEGCNKMTCSSCQSHMCYLCRVHIPSTGPRSGYGHFCQTPFCEHASCGQCPLYTDPIEDDRRAMRQAADDAKAAATRAAEEEAARAMSSASSLASSSASSAPEATRYQPIAAPRLSAAASAASQRDVDVDRLLEQPHAATNCRQQ